ncbi:MAG: hypothetical protein IJV74_04560, partial [Clostridia bacterium]|nr:hypothetical protein [Clostridia bacterium]
MKKSIVYSFAALASFPVLAEAANVDLPEDKWGGAYVDGKVQSTDGSVLKQSVELVQGKYKVTVKSIIVPNGGSVTVKAGSASKEIKANGDVTLEITLASKTNVNVSVEGSGIFTFEDATIELDFNFANAVAALQQQLNGLTETLNTYQGADKKKENEQAAGLIQEKLNLISESQSYQDYANYALYDLDNSSLTADINKLAEKAADDETKYIGSTGAEELTQNLTAVTKQIDEEDPNKSSF